MPQTTMAAEEQQAEIIIPDYSADGSAATGVKGLLQGDAGQLQGQQQLGAAPAAAGPKAWLDAALSADGIRSGFT